MRSGVGRGNIDGHSLRGVAVNEGMNVCFRWFVAVEEGSHLGVVFLHNINFQMLVQTLID